MKELDIYRKILKDPTYEIGQKAKSPIPLHIRGMEDDAFSFCTKVYSGHIRWKDFGFESQRGASLKGLVSYIKGVSVMEAKRLIKNVADMETIAPTQEEIEAAQKEPIVFHKKKLEYYHMRYMEQLLITRDILDLYEVTGLSHLTRGNREIWKESRLNFGYHYTIGSGEKSYRPFNITNLGKKSKYFHQDVDLPEGYLQLPQFIPLLVITKSLKDVMHLRALGYYAISGSSESMYEMMRAFVPDLNSRCKDLVFWGDPDPQGQRYVQALKEMFGRGRVAHSTIAKDPTDIWLESFDRSHTDNIIRIAA